MSDPGSLIFTLLVFATVFAVVATVGLRFLASGASPKPTPGTDQTPMTSEDAAWAQRLLESGVAQSRKGAGAERDMVPGSGTRTAVRTILRILSAILLAYLVTITIASYLEGSPHDGSYLLTGILVIVTLMAAGYFHTLDQRFRTSESHATLRDDLLHTVEADVAAKIGGALLDGTKVEWSVAAPEVHSMDLEALESGRSMLADGKSLDEVCRAIEPEYGGWVAGHQQAFQAVVRAALEHGA